MVGKQRGDAQKIGPRLIRRRSFPLIEPLDDGCVIAGSVRKRVAGQPAPGGFRQRAMFTELCQYPRIVIRRNDHADMVMVLGRRSHHGRTSDIDQLDRRIGGERVEVADHQVDETDAQSLQGVEMFGLGPVGQDPAVDGRMECLHPAAEHLGCAGQIGHLDVGDPSISQCR